MPGLVTSDRHGDSDTVGSEVSRSDSRAESVTRDRAPPGTVTVTGTPGHGPLSLSPSHSDMSRSQVTSHHHRRLGQPASESLALVVGGGLGVRLGGVTVRVGPGPGGLSRSSGLSTAQAAGAARAAAAREGPRQLLGARAVRREDGGRRAGAWSGGHESGATRRYAGPGLTAVSHDNHGRA